MDVYPPLRGITARYGWRRGTRRCPGEQRSDSTAWPPASRDEYGSVHWPSAEQSQLIASPALGSAESVSTKRDQLLAC